MAYGQVFAIRINFQQSVSSSHSLEVNSTNQMRLMLEGTNKWHVRQVQDRSFSMAKIQQRVIVNFLAEGKLLLKKVV